MHRWKLILAVCFCTVLAGAFTACNLPRATAASDQSAEIFTAADAPAIHASLTTALTGGPRLVRVYFNPYTDSIKTVLNYYVNVEGEYSDGSYLPLDSSTIELRCDYGTLEGNAWVIPKKIDFEKVTFTAVSRENPRLRDTVTLWIQRWKDPRDAADWEEPDE